MSASETLKPLIIHRTFDALRELVWKAWSDVEIIKKWWGPKIFYAPTIKVDFQVGGKYLFCMQSDIGEGAWKKGIWSTGIYKEIIPMEKIVFTDNFADEHGNIVPSSYYGMKGIPENLLVTISLEDTEEGRTNMTLKHEGIPEFLQKDTSAGWNESFDKLAETIKQK